MLTNPTNGAFGLVSSRLPGSTVTIQCDAGYVSAIDMVTCESTLMWSPDPDIECTLLTEPPPTPCKCFLVVHVDEISDLSSTSYELHSSTTPTKEWHYQ